MNGNIISQGSFTSTGADQILEIPSGVSLIYVDNLTQLAASQTTAVGVSYKWNSTLANGSKIVRFKSSAGNAANLDQYITTNGFYLFDSAAPNTFSVQNTISSISTASIPLVTNTGTNGLAAGDVVQLIDVTGGLQISGYHFTVSPNNLTATTFELAYMQQIAAATTGSFRKIAYDPIFYPPTRYITDITLGSTTVVKFSVTHNYRVGMEIRFKVPVEFGTYQLDTLKGTILSVNTTNNTVTVDIDSSGFNAFTFPLSADVPFSPALCNPVGNDSAFDLANQVSYFNTATENTAYRGIRLRGGQNNPAGQSGDVISWTAFKAQ